MMVKPLEVTIRYGSSSIVSCEVMVTLWDPTSEGAPMKMLRGEEEATDA